jgi:hypothetical protein
MAYQDAATWSPIADPYYAQTKVLIKNGSLTDASFVRRTMSMTGTVPVSAAVGAPPVIKAPSLTGNPGNVFQISNSTSNYIYFSGNASDFDMSNPAWTLELWINMPVTGASYSHWFWCGGQSNQGELKCWSGDGKPYVYSAAGQSIVASVSITSGVWTHVVVERYNGVMYMWINGANRSSSSTMPTGGTPGSVGIGIPQSSEYYPAYIDEVRWTTVARYQGAINIPVQTISWPER